MDTVVMLLSIALVNLLAWLTPGPNVIAVMSASVRNGRRHGVLTGLGLSACAVLWANHAITATVFSTDLVVRWFSAARRRTTAVFGLVFAGLGVGVAYDAIRRA